MLRRRVTGSMIDFNFGTRVIFGDGVRSLLPEQLVALGVRRPLLITDGGLVRAGVVERVASAFAAGCRPELFDLAPENPTEAAVGQAARSYRDRSCDGIVGLGGGSPMDLAKALAVLIGDGRPLALRAFHICGWNAPPLPAVPPLVLMPTTAGTGSEVSRGAVLTFKDGRKSGILARGVVRLALCDPELTHGLPTRMTAATGVDAMSHCVEAFCSPTFHPLADALALDGLQRLATSIEAAASEGSNANARSEMMLGSMAGGLCLQKGLGAVHALSHPLGATGVHHGQLNAVLLPHVLAWNASALSAKLPRLRYALGLPPAGDVETYFHGLRERLGLAGRLRELGIDRADLPTYAERSLADSSQSNPRPMAAPDYLAVLTAAW